MRPEMHPSTVMLVDDTPANLRIMQEILRNAGYQVVAFPEGAAALKAAARKPPDIILLDILMPRMNGFEVCRRLKADPALKDIPVLFISAVSEQTEKVKAFAAGAVDYVTKPFHEQEVLARVATHVKLYRLTRELEGMVAERTAQLTAANASMAREIVMRKEAEAHLRDNRAMLQSVFEGIREPLVLLDRQMRVKLMNKAAAVYYGRTGLKPEVGMRLCLEKGDAGVASCRDCRIPEAVSKGEVFVWERKGFANSERIEKMFVYPVEEERRKTGDAIIRISDITEDHRLRQELAQADKLIALGTLVAGVAHEINNPNHVILLNAPILSEVWQKITPILDDYCDAKGDFQLGALTYGQLRDEIPGLISGIETSASRIKRIVDVLKDYSAKNDKPVTDLVNVNAALKNAVLILKEKIKKMTDRFEVVYGSDLPEIKADLYSLEQVFVNLISNALEALPDRGRGVSVETRHDPEMDQVAVFVCDQGCGIAQTQLSRIMDPFFTTKRAKGGTGLGLAIIQQIVKQHKGRLEVESREGEGSTFTVTFPAIRPASEEKGGTAPASRGGQR